MKKEIKAVFVIEGKRQEELPEELANCLEKSFKEYFESHHSEWESVLKAFLKENDEK